MYVVRPSPEHPDHLDRSQPLFEPRSQAGSTTDHPDWSKEYQEGRGRIRFVYLVYFDSTCLFIFLVFHIRAEHRRREVRR